MQRKNRKTLFRNIRLLLLDVDGVLTKGEIIYDSLGRELKIFNVKDGLGIFLLGKVGIKTIIITAKDGKVVKRRAKDMGVVQVFGGILPKEKCLASIVKKYRVKLSEICFIGDDLIDIGIMKKVGLSVAVSDAARQVKRSADYVTVKPGGQGAVREIVDLIIAAQNLSAKLQSFLKNPK